jgi:predicted nucleotidyltransferase
MGTLDGSPSTSPAYPGTPEHQRLLRAITDHYAEDARVRAVVVFGSLGRGTWDAYSDLDLDVVLADGVRIDVFDEVRLLCQSLGEPPVVILPDRDDAADVVLASLLLFSIRYHPLHATSPNIVDSLVVLAGTLDAGAIIAAGLANRTGRPDLSKLLGACVRQAVLTDAQLHRRAFWFAYSSLAATRERLLVLFARCHDAVRPYHTLEAADATVKARFGRTLPGGTLSSVQQAFLGLLHLLDHDLEVLSAGRARLTDEQRRVLARIRRRQARLDLKLEHEPGTPV